MELSGQSDILSYIVNQFDIYHIPYLLTGSIAVAGYGYPRTTHDIDFILEINPQNQNAVTLFLKNLDKSFITDNLPLSSSLTNSLITLLHISTGIKIDLWVLDKKDDFEESKFARGKKSKINGMDITQAAAEDIIITKLKWCKKIRSERHLTDCAGILAIQEKLDMKYLKKWIKKLGLSKVWKDVQKIKPQTN
ncbi:hypothetical protein A3D77_00255 [Candidatus Gottesmanbacteria bacterium RIFCSPHIGHO2_02_FULL_39_11]|uniref:Uncharacterized protein n=1 Tax=Candidatus Gottesmanbacteria bacterium RIFCSPHIGHO2_02_FULL_39_11 TaxID=1798382 RepID=A0A1F5ZWV6_9BACT|nr:MAG: hypothetical protein A3D77_00255 [Candidatus Gottesmanbacteria bacterium RIFCSPHIGHO2_02_FULL_39_11]